MKLSYNGQEKVQAPPAAVWAFVQDPQRVAACLPAVQDIQVAGPNQLVATVNVGMGMLRGKFKVNIEVQPDQSAGRVSVLVKGGGVGSALDMSAGANVVDGGDGTTTLDWQGEAEITGPLASVGGRMIEPQAQKLIERTFRNMSAQIGRSDSQLA